MGDVLELERVRWRVADFHKMGEAGILAEADRLELIDGEIVKMAPIGGQGEFAPSGLNPESMELGPKAGQHREFPV
ncbi:MAG: hypothetical protein WCA12_14025 [Burkholderiales bacterium]